MSTKVRGIPLGFVFRESDPYGQTQELKYSKNKKWQEPKVGKGKGELIRWPEQRVHKKGYRHRS